MFLIMRKIVTIEKIEKEIKDLSPQEQLKLLETLVHHLRKIYLPPTKELDGVDAFLTNDEKLKQIKEINVLFLKDYV